VEGWEKKETYQGKDTQHLVILMCCILNTECAKRPLFSDGAAVQELITLPSKIMNLALICWAKQGLEAKQLIPVFIIFFF